MHSSLPRLEYLVSCVSFLYVDVSDDNAHIICQVSYVDENLISHVRFSDVSRVSSKRFLSRRSRHLRVYCDTPTSTRSSRRGLIVAVSMVSMLPLVGVGKFRSNRSNRSMILGQSYVAVSCSKIRPGISCFCTRKLRTNRQV